MVTIFTRSEQMVPTRCNRNPASRKRRRGLFLERLESRELLALVSHWTGDNTAADAMGTNHATLVSGATYAAGQIGQTFRFDGIDDRVVIADSPSLALTASLSIEGWIRTDSQPTAQHGNILFRGDDRGGLDPYWMSLESTGQLRFQVESLSAAAGISTPFPIGQFVHVAGTLDDASGAMRLYINGVLMAQTVTTVRPFGDLDPASNPGVGIGNHGGYPNTPHNFPFNGLIDELKLYSHALTSEDVLGIYNAGKGSLQQTFSISDVTADEASETAQYQGNFATAGDGGLDDPYALAYGPDGNLYVSNRSGSSILRYDASTSEPRPAAGKQGAEFVSPGAAGLNLARHFSFGPDGNLYVVSELTNSVLRFDATTGEPVDNGQFIAAGAGGLDRPRGLLFHTDGYLYVTSVGTTSPGPGMDAILRYDAATGAPAGLSGQPGDAVFILSGSGGLDNPSQIVFHNGSFYVASTSPSTSNSVLRYAADGSFLGAFVPTGSGGLSGPADLAFHDGWLYVTSWANNKLLRYNGTTGAFVDQVVSDDGLRRPFGLVFRPDGSFLVSSGDSDEIRKYGTAGAAVFTISLSAPMPSFASVSYQTEAGTALASSDFLLRSGTVDFAPGQWRKTVTVPIVNDLVGEPTETFVVNLSGAVGASISDDSGVGTIVDDDPGPTKFYVVNDGSPDRTYEYGSKGKSIENYAINTGNTAPRGAASTIVGDRVWVVDVNKKVYVYNTSGFLLGSWTAGGLGGSAQLEGIATNGVDVWLVDNKSDKVFRYANAASRTSGTQNAASSFSLYNKGPFSPDYSNKNPKDIVTDGTHLWVLNDGVSEDKLFKYTLSGTAVWENGWTLDPANSQPTGVTLDPGNPYDFWIVDSGTNCVYRYAAAVRQAGGGLAHPFTDSFALAAGNNNPQGIADPPVAGAINSESASVSRPLVPALLVDHLLIQPADSPNLPPGPGAQPARERDVEIGTRWLRANGIDEWPTIAGKTAPAEQTRWTETIPVDAADQALMEFLDSEGLLVAVRKQRR